MIQPLNKDWMLSSNVATGVATNFDDFDSDSIRVSGSFLAHWLLEPELTLGFGLVMNYNFGELLPLPGLLVDWRPNSLIKVDIFVPSHAIAAVSFLERFEVGLKLKMDGNRFVIREEGNTQVDNVKYSIIDAGLIAAARLAGQFWVTAFGGTTLRHRFEVFDASDDKVVDLDIDPGLVLRFGVEIRT